MDPKKPGLPPIGVGKNVSKPSSEVGAAKPPHSKLGPTGGLPSKLGKPMGKSDISGVDPAAPAFGVAATLRPLSGIAPIVKPAVEEQRPAPGHTVAPAASQPEPKPVEESKPDPLDEPLPNEVVDSEEDDDEGNQCTMMLESPEPSALDDFLDNEKTQLNVSAMEADPLCGTLTVEAGKTPQKEYKLLRDKTTIGRGTKNDIIVPDISMSRTHACIEKFKEGFRLRDMDSSNGIVLNGYRIRVGQLRNGDCIEIGNVRFRFEQTGGDPDELWAGKPIIDYHPKQRGSDGQLLPPITDGSNNAVQQPVQVQPIPGMNQPQPIPGMQPVGMQQPVRNSWDNNPGVSPIVVAQARAETAMYSPPSGLNNMVPPGAPGDPQMMQPPGMASNQFGAVAGGYMVAPPPYAQVGDPSAAKKQSLLMKIIAVMAVLFLLNIFLIILKQINDRNERAELERQRVESSRSAKYLQQGVSFFAKRRWDEATAAFKQVEGDNPVVATYMKEIPKESEIQNNIEAAIRRIKEDSSVQNIKETIDALNDVPPQSVFYNEVQERMSNYELRYRKAIGLEIRFALSNDDIPKAEKMLALLKGMKSARSEYMDYMKRIVSRKNNKG